MIEPVIELAERLPVLAFLAGMALLLGGGHWLVEGSVAIARRLGIPTLIIGLTIVACGTSAPELFFNVAAVAGGNAELCFGNVVGSNIANLGLVLGTAALICPLAVHRQVVAREIPVLMLASAAMFLLPLLGGVPEAWTSGYGRTAGIILLTGFVALIGLWIVAARRGGEVPVDEVDADSSPQPIWRGAAFVALGLAALIVGGRGAEIGAVGIAASLGLSKALIGLTIVAIATSLPEVVTVVIAARRGHADLAVGNVVGSNLFNILFVLGTTSVVGPVPIPDGGMADLVMMSVLTVVLLPFALTNGRQVLRWQSGLLGLAYVGFLTWKVLAELGFGAPA